MTPTRFGDTQPARRGRRTTATQPVLPEPTALEISRMGRSDYLAFCARHLARARQRAES